MAKKVVRNDEGKVVPDHCSCGGKIGVFIEGEPIYKCTACGKYYGTMPFPKKSLNESLNKENKNMKKNVVKINENTLRQIVIESVKNALKEEGEGDERFLSELKDTYGNLRKEYERWQHSTFMPQGMDEAMDSHIFSLIEAIKDAMHIVKDTISRFKPTYNIYYSC